MKMFLILAFVMMSISSQSHATRLIEDYVCEGVESGKPYIRVLRIPTGTNKPGYRLSVTDQKESMEVPEFYIVERIEGRTAFNPTFRNNEVSLSFTGNIDQKSKGNLSIWWTVSTPESPQMVSCNAAKRGF